jgi:leader peptidase (prepilin peptidase)/N-methyltransferase
LILFVIFLIGLVIGSFVGVIIHRLPNGEQFIAGRSYCQSCKRVLQWNDLIPVLSFLALKGRCRYCRGKISPVNLAVEILSGIIFAVSFFFLSPLGLAHWLFWVLVLELFLILAFIDLKFFILPDSVMAVIFAAFVCYEIIGGAVVESGSVFSFNNLACAAAWFLIFFLIWRFSGGKGMGLGDAKLAGLTGLIFGFWNSVFILYLAVAAGAAAGLMLILSGKGGLKTKLPLGTFIGFSVVFFILFGSGTAGKIGEFWGRLIFRLNLF